MLGIYTSATRFVFATTSVVHDDLVCYFLLKGLIWPFPAHLNWIKNRNQQKNTIIVYTPGNYAAVLRKHQPSSTKHYIASHSAYLSSSDPAAPGLAQLA